MTTDTLTKPQQPSSIHTITRVGVVGAGQMGSGIAQVVASLGGLPVVMVDSASAQLDKAKAGIEKSLAKLAEKQKLGDTTPEASLERLTFSQSFDDLASCDLVIEAIVEQETVKADLFAKLNAITAPTTILASNTSSISITRLAKASGRPDKVVGMHFMNPVPLMALVEIINGAQTSPDTTATVVALAHAWGKTTAVAKDFPGFISNRVLMPLINEAIYAVYEGVGTPEAVDTVMRLGMNHPMGPLTLADFIGLDTCLAIMTVLHDGFKDPRFRPCPLLQQYVDAGWFGKKSGRGFYTYNS